MLSYYQSHIVDCKTLLIEAFACDG